MKIGIEAQRLFRRRKFGMDVVAMELIRHLQKIDHSNEYIVFVASGRNDCIPETANFIICEIRGKIYPVWEQLKLPAVAKSKKVDFLHCTANTAPLWPRSPLILTLHDTISLEHNHCQRTKTWYQRIGNQYRKFLIPRIIKKTMHLITVSETEKQNIVEMLHVDPDLVTVVHNGVDKRYQPVTDKQIQADFRKKYQLPEHYIAFIGNTDPRKNVANTLKAYDEYLKGSKEKRILAMLHNEKPVFESNLTKSGFGHLKDWIKILGYIESDDMPTFYSSADMFLYPSLREGFGMPVIEAMACGTPVITSNVSSMPEVGGDAVLYVTPTDYKDIARQMLRLEAHPEMRMQMIDAGFIQCKKFSWEKTAQKVHAVYQQVFSQLGK